MSANTSTESKPTYSLAGRAKNFINNEQLSDICFLVGQSDNAKKIYGHKLFLAMGSPVFEKMFFGDLPEKKDLIVIQELTAVGFMNMIRYIYAEQVDFELHELYETYMAANMFMVYDLCDTIRSYLDKKLNKKNRILIYEQFIKIKIYDPSIDDNLLNKVRRSIDKSAFSNEYFNKISEEMLIDILNIEYLDIKETLILKSCLNWANDSKSTIEDKKISFKKIRPYINFSGMTFEDLKLFKKIDSFLNQDEVFNLVMFLMDKKNRSYPFELKTKRKCVLRFNFSRIIGETEEFKEKKIYSINFSVNHDTLIKSIKTSMPYSSSKITFDSDGETLEPNFFKLFQKGELTLVFPKFLIIRADSEYRITFNYNREVSALGLYYQIEKIEYEGIDFFFKKISGNNFIKKIKFFKG